MIIRFVISILVMCFLGWLLCDIDPSKDYSWYYGIWHGMFLPFNFVRSILFDNVYWIAQYHSGAYSVFFWIFGIPAALAEILGSARG